MTRAVKWEKWMSEDLLWVCPSCGAELNADCVGEKCPACGVDLSEFENDKE